LVSISGVKVRTAKLPTDKMSTSTRVTKWVCKKTAKESNLTMGSNSPNLVTLTSTLLPSKCWRHLLMYICMYLSLLT
jgi:hypothetical protein